MSYLFFLFITFVESGGGIFDSSFFYFSYYVSGV
jgi:hypothetical protein